MAFTFSHSAGKGSNDYATTTHYRNSISPGYKTAAKLISCVPTFLKITP
jgi:hypothetical protein